MFCTPIPQREEEHDSFKHLATVRWIWHKILNPDPLLFISLVIASSASIPCPLSLDSAKV